MQNNRWQKWVYWFFYSLDFSLICQTGLKQSVLIPVSTGPFRMNMFINYLISAEKSAFVWKNNGENA